MCTEQRREEAVQWCVTVSRCDGSVTGASVVTQLQKINGKSSERVHRQKFQYWNQNVIIFSGHVGVSQTQWSLAPQLGHWASLDTGGWDSVPHQFGLLLPPLSLPIPIHNCSDWRLEQLNPTRQLRLWSCEAATDKQHSSTGEGYGEDSVKAFAFPASETVLVMQDILRNITLSSPSHRQVDNWKLGTQRRRW